MENDRQKKIDFALSRAILYVERFLADDEARQIFDETIPKAFEPHIFDNSKERDLLTLSQDIDLAFMDSGLEINAMINSEVEVSQMVCTSDPGFDPGLGENPNPAETEDALKRMISYAMNEPEYNKFNWETNPAVIDRFTEDELDMVCLHEIGHAIKRPQDNLASFIIENREIFLKNGQLDIVLINKAATTLKRNAEIFSDGFAEFCKPHGPRMADVRLKLSHEIMLKQKRQHLVDAKLYLGQTEDLEKKARHIQSVEFDEQELKAYEDAEAVLKDPKQIEIFDEKHYNNDLYGPLANFIQNSKNCVEALTPLRTANYLEKVYDGYVAGYLPPVERMKKAK